MGGKLQVPRSLLYEGMVSTRDALRPDGAFATRRLYVQFPRSQEEKGALFYKCEKLCEITLFMMIRMCMVQLYFCFEDPF